LKPVNEIVRHRTLLSRDTVRRYNRTVAQFAYRLIIAPRRCDDLALRYGGVGPTVQYEIGGTPTDIQITWRHVFGPRPKLAMYVTRQRRRRGWKQ
jgi:hypothetical protein